MDEHAWLVLGGILASTGLGMAALLVWSEVQARRTARLMDEIADLERRTDAVCARIADLLAREV